MTPVEERTTEVTIQIMTRISPYLKPVQLQSQPHPFHQTRDEIYAILMKEFAVPTREI